MCEKMIFLTLEIWNSEPRQPDVVIHKWLGGWREVIDLDENDETVVIHQP